MAETHDNRTETHACDLISRQAAFDALNGIKIAKGANWYEFYQKALTAVGNLPSAQHPDLKCEDCDILKEYVEAYRKKEGK